MNKYLSYKNKIIRKNLFKFRFSHFSMKYFSLKRDISVILKFKIMLKIQQIVRNNFLTRIKTRCINTNYPRAIIRYTNTSKSEFKRLVSLAAVTGFKKSSW